MLAPGLLTLFSGGEASRHDDGARRHIVEIQGMTFQPAVLEVERGDTVVWVNRDMVPHTATGTGGQSWTTGVLSQSQSGQYVVLTRGVTAYFCELHPVMEGKLIAR
ncbi:MAG TPA: plastocyanin/azurin family copper-binding protein [Gemmatimonadales bacterium]|nr:plastocyanin/azurin family copper-binding protein [Gemmatimonadales bacterium]